MNYKRLLTSTILGAILGVFCIIGMSSRLPPTPLPNSTIYLLNGWYNRVVMGIIIGLSGEIAIIQKNKDSLLNTILRGAIIGAIVSVSPGLLGQSLAVTYFGAGIMFGILNDVITTKFLAWQKSKKK